MFNDTIINGDTLQTLKSFDSDIVDITVTSPPYNKRIKSSGKKSIMKAIQYDSISDDLPEEEYQEKQILIMDELFRVTKPGGALFYNHKVRHLRGIATHPMEWIPKTKWHLRQEIIWNRKGPVEVGGYRFYQVDERIYWLYKPENNNVIGKKLLSKHARMLSVWEFSPDKKNDHPAPFPLDLPLRCILSFLDDAPGVVLDPYMGSGTTAVAAKLLGKNYIGIDISGAYIEKANKRIENFESERPKLEKELKLHFVEKSWQERKTEKEQINLNKMFK